MAKHEILYQFRIDADARAALEKLPACVQEANPIPERTRGALRFEIRDLWRALTMERSRRNIDYLNDPAFFSAYLRYFLPWNLVRLTALLTDMTLSLEPHATIVDIGAGPLTFAIALYCAKPELRKIPLTILCADRAPRIMEAGKLILEILAVKHTGELPPWEISLKRAKFGEPLAQKADLLVAANVFNEFFWKHEGMLADEAAELYRKVSHYCEPSGSILIVEPGEPRSGSLMSALRAAAIFQGDSLRAPCPHARACPMPGIFRSGQEHLSETAHHAQDRYRAKSAAPERAGTQRSLLRVRMPSLRTKYPWCHFSVNAAFAPKWLARLSEEAGLAKEKLSFSFIFVERNQRAAPTAGEHLEPNRRDRNERAAAGAESKYRIVSDIISLPGDRQGRYACGLGGYTLIATSSRESLPESGALVSLHTPEPQEAPQENRPTGRCGPQSESTKPRPATEVPEYDQKSGAILISY